MGLFLPTTMPTYYEILNVSESASSAEIKSAYRTLAKTLHPDLNKSENAKEEFIELEEAYACLYKKETRFAYDRLLRFEREKLRNNNVHRKFENDVNRRRQRARKRASTHASMNYRQYRVDEILHDSFAAIVLKALFTILFGAMLFWITFKVIIYKFGTFENWKDSGANYSYGMVLIALLVGASYLYEPLADLIVKAFSRKKRK